MEDEGCGKLKERILAYVDEVYPDKHRTFKVHSRRARKEYPMESMEINAALGEAILQAYPEMSVDVHEPEILLNVEIREKIYIYSETIPGPGGMPVGTGGKAMLLLSGGIDSPVAGYMIAKRGVKLDAVYFMRRLTPASGRSRRWWTWRRLCPGMWALSGSTSSISRIFSSIFMKNAPTRS